MMVLSREFHSALSTNELFQCMSRSLKTYYKAKELCDVTIKCSVDNIALSAHKLILVSVSPFFYHALVGPLSTKDTVELPFTSTTVRCFLDCVYQHQDAITDADVDVMEFIYLAKYLDVQALLKLGLRVAAMRLTPKNSFQSLIDITKPNAGPVPEEWLDVVIRYELRTDDHHDSFNDDGRWEHENYVHDLSLDLVSTLWSYTMECCFSNFTLRFIWRLLKCYVEHNIGMKSVENLQQMLSTDVKVNLEHMMTQLEELNELFNHVCDPFVKLDAIKEVQMVNRTRVKNDDILVQLRFTTLPYHLDFVFCPKKREVVERDDIPLFDRSLSEMLMKNINEPLSNVKKDNKRKYFMWDNSLFSVYCIEEYKSLWVTWEWYDWVKGQWTKFRKGFYLDIHDDDEDGDIERFPINIVSCLSWELVSFVLFLDHFEEKICLMTGQVQGERTISCPFDEYGPYNPNYLQLAIANNAYLAEVSLLLFLTPLRALVFPMIDAVHGRSSRMQKVEFAHPNTNIQWNLCSGKMISFKDKVLHVYTPRQDNALCESIHVDCLDLEKKIWISVGKLCGVMEMVDALVLNEEIHLVYKKSGSDTQHFIAKCHIRNDSKIELVQGSEIMLRDVGSGENVERFVVRKCAMPLDLL